MPDAILLSFLGLWLMAAASHKHCREAGVCDPRAKRALRLLGSLALVLAFTTCGTELTGERVVRALGAASVAGVALVLLLSFRPALAFAPLRRALALSRGRTPTSPSAARAVPARVSLAANSRGR